MINNDWQTIKMTSWYAFAWCQMPQSTDQRKQEVWIQGSIRACYWRNEISLTVNNKPFGYSWGALPKVIGTPYGIIGKSPRSWPIIINGKCHKISNTSIYHNTRVLCSKSLPLYYCWNFDTSLKRKWWVGWTKPMCIRKCPPIQYYRYLMWRISNETPTT